ncbi:MAG: hypothetical protein L0Z50_20140 [Verrucomicrobiales bacterium]|nr:hypothetical protein [Verrucomicrobiales bacterium]
MIEPDFNKPLRPIAAFAATDDFPRNALGEFVDIGGYTGVVVEIVSHSIKVRSQEGTTQRFNYNTLRRLYGPRIEPDPEVPVELSRPPSASQTASEMSSAPAQPREILDPDFNRPLKPIKDLAGRSDFPQCAFGEFVEIGDYAGVVVAIVNQSLKIRSRQGTSRKYNAEILRKLYGK